MLCYECAIRPADHRRLASSASGARVCRRCGTPLPALDGTGWPDRFALDPDGQPLLELVNEEN